MSIGQDLDPSWASVSWSADQLEPEWAVETDFELSTESSYRTYDFEDTTFGTIIRKRQANGRNFQAVITSRGGERGLGKTTLAITLGRLTDPNGWTIDKGHMSVWSFMRHYLRGATSGDVLVQDETEIAADRRRAVSGSNVMLSQVIAAARYKEVSSIYTLPTKHMLDKRIFGLCTFWIHVVEPGTAAIFRIVQKDFGDSAQIFTIPLRGADGNQEYIYWDPLDDDEEYQQFTQKKEDFMRNYVNRHILDGDEGPDDETKVQWAKSKEAVIRDGLIKSIHENNPELTQTEVADRTQNLLEAMDGMQHKTSVSQPQVWKVLDDEG